MKVLVTGATGHIGINLMLALLERGHQVRAFCRSPQKMQVIAKQAIEVYQGDVLSIASLKAAFNGIDAVVHLAGKISIDGDPDGSVRQTNVLGTRHVVAVALEKQVKKFIHFSSIHALQYSSTATLVDESNPYAGPKDFHYNQSKALGEKEVLKGVDQGLNATILNPTAVIGPHDYFQSRSGEMLAQLFAGKMPFLVRGGFDWVDVQDIVQATLFVLQNEVPSRRYLLAGHWANFKTLSKLCQSISGLHSNTYALPLSFAFLALPFVRLTQLVTQQAPLYTYESLMIIKEANQNFSSQLAQSELHFQARPLQTTLETIFAWRQQYVANSTN